MLAPYISFCISSRQIGQVLRVVIFRPQMLLLKLHAIQWLVQGHTAGGWWRDLLTSIFCP